MNRYYTEEAFQNQFAMHLDKWQLSPFHRPMDWVQYHHTLPPAYMAGKVAPAGGYAEMMPASTQYTGMAQNSNSLVGPMAVGALFLALLWSR
jgi:hypothetical protein